MSDVVNQIQKASVELLSRMVQQTIADVERQVVDAIGDFKALSQQASDVIQRFEDNVHANFDELMDREVFKQDAVYNFETLSLVQEEELDVMVALEGMVNASRNEHLAVFISFNTRLASLFPRKRIDESTNPLDPEQIATAFQEALRPLGLDAQNTLTVYRAFNSVVLKAMDEVLSEANKILIDNNVMADLGMDHSNQAATSTGRSVPRVDPTSAFGTVEEEAFDEDEDRPELFSLMQNLLHSDNKPAAPAAPASPSEGGDFMIPSGMVPQQPQTSEPGEGSGVMQPFQPQEGQTVQMVDQAKLMEVLTSIQDKLSSMPAAPAGSMEEVERLDISQSLGEILQSTSGDENVVSAVDRQSSDIINLVSLLYEAIWQDNSVPIPIKELIGRTQVTIIRVALADVDFFNNENHPARAILNEFASAGLGWTEVEELEKDPLYQKMQELVERILLEYTGDNSLFDELIQDFRAFRAKEAAKTRQLEQRILKATERKDRIDDINELVTQKIEERILGRELDPFIEELLRGPFHKFMVMLVVKEGPGSSAWKQSVNTIDVLLWSVQRHDESGDRDRLTTVRPRLINNLRKAFRIAGIDKDEIDQLILQLERVQNESFGAEADEEPATEEVTEAGESAASEAEPETEEDTDSETSEPKVHFLAAGEEPEPVEDKTEVAADSTAAEVQDAEEEAPAEDEAGKPDELAEDDPHMVQVENLAVGQWVEFAGEDDENNSRCKLAAKINAIDKLIFVNRQGIKIAEKTKMGLALELRDGTVSIVSDGLLFSRALESVIGNLRESQHEQQTGSAYQPGEVAENS